MEQKTLDCSLRTEFKTGAAKRLRRDGKIPAIIYGHQKPLAISVDAHEFHTKFKIISENIIIKLTIGSESYDVLVKEFQENIIKEKITHIDFYEVEKGKLLKTHVPIKIVGTAVGVKMGGIFEFLLHELEVECLPRNLPEKIIVNIDTLDLGKSIHVKDLGLSEDIKSVNSENQVVCHVIRKKDTIEKPESEEAAAPGKTEGA